MDQNHKCSYTKETIQAEDSLIGAKPTGTRPGNRYIERALGTAALSVSRSQSTYLGAKYRRTELTTVA